MLLKDLLGNPPPKCDGEKDLSFFIPEILRAPTPDRVRSFDRTPSSDALAAATPSAENTQQVGYEEN